MEVFIQANNDACKDCGRQFVESPLFTWVSDFQVSDFFLIFFAPIFFAGRLWLSLRNPTFLWLRRVEFLV